MTYHVSHGSEYQADHGYHASGFGVKAIPDEFGHGELSEFAKVGSEQQGQQDVSSRPSHQEDGPAVTIEGDQPRHRDEGSGRHPVRRRGHAVGYRVDPTSRNVEFLGRPGPGPNRDSYVKDEGGSNHQIGKCLQVHRYLVLLDTELVVELVHFFDVDEDQDHEGIDRSLLCEPKP